MALRGLVLREDCDTRDLDLVLAVALLHAVLIAAGIMLAFPLDDGITVSHVPLLVYVRAEGEAPAPLIMVCAARAPTGLLNNTGAVLDTGVNVTAGPGSGFLKARLLLADVAVEAVCVRLLGDAGNGSAVIHCPLRVDAGGPSALLHGLCGDAYVAAVSLYPVLLLIGLSSALSVVFVFSVLLYRLRLPSDPRGATAILGFFDDFYRRAALAILVLATAAFVLFLAGYTGFAGEAFTAAMLMLLLAMLRYGVHVMRREKTRLWRAARKVLLFALLVFSAVYALIASMLYRTDDAMSMVDIARYAAIATLYLMPYIILLGALAAHILYMIRGDQLLTAPVIVATSLLGIVTLIAEGGLVGLLTLPLVLAPLLPSLAALQGITELASKRLPMANKPSEETLWELLALFSTPAALGVSMLFARLYFTRIQVLQLVGAIAVVAAIAYFEWRSTGRGPDCRPALYSKALALAATVAGMGAAAGIPIINVAAVAVAAAAAFAASSTLLAGKSCSVLRHHTLKGAMIGEATLQATMAFAVLLLALDAESAVEPLRLLGANTSPEEVLTRILVAASLVQAMVLSYVYAELWLVRRRCGGVTVS